MRLKSQRKVFLLFLSKCLDKVGLGLERVFGWEGSVKIDQGAVLKLVDSIRR